jgi:hypothetical protein
VNCPGLIISITPPHVHNSLELLFSAGMPAIRTVGDPGIHGAVVTGMQGMGVSTPIAAAVAAATVGFAGDAHIAKDMIFTNGLLSMILAIGMAVLTLLIGRTVKELGANPKLHLSMALPHTDWPIYLTTMKQFLIFYDHLFICKISKCCNQYFSIW